jgi:hypothetical protein
LRSFAADNLEIEVRRIFSVLWTVVVLSISGLGPSALAQTEVKLVDGLIGHWPLESDARDRSVRNREAANRGVQFGRFARGKPAAKFAGRGEFLEIAAGRSPDLEDGDFSVTAWVHTANELDDALGDIVSQFDDQSRCGFSLRVTTSGTTLSQPNVRHVSFGIDNGRIEPAWTDHGRPGQSLYAMAMAVHDRKLFVGTCEPEKDQAGHVYRLGARGEWVDCGSPDRSGNSKVLPPLLQPVVFDEGSQLLTVETDPPASQCLILSRHVSHVIVMVGKRRTDMPHDPIELLFVHRHELDRQGLIGALGVLANEAIGL